MTTTRFKRMCGSRFSVQERLALVALLLLSLGVMAGCSSPNSGHSSSRPVADETLLPGMPPVLDPNNIYSADHAGNLSPVVKNFPDRIYVPNSGSNSVDIIDPKTYKIIGHFPVGRQPQHVTPSWDLKTLWVLNDLFVAEPARRRGVGARLLGAAKDHAARTGAARLVLSTAVDNFTAQALYERLGWQKDTAFVHYKFELPADSGPEGGAG